jgi:hypothetical protein
VPHIHAAFFAKCIEKGIAFCDKEQVHYVPLRMAYSKFRLAPVCLAGQLCCFYGVPASADDRAQGAQEPASSSSDSTTPAAPDSAESGFKLAGFGGIAWLGFGVPAGDAAGPAYSVYDPVFAFGCHGELSFAFVYAGAGYQWIRFTDEAPTQQRVMSEQGAEFEREGSSNTNLYDVEGGLVHVFSPYPSLKIRPSLGYGVSTDGEVTKNIVNCSNCPAYPVLDAYRGGRYLRAQVGFFLKNPTAEAAFGLNVSFQQFLGEITEPALNRVLSFGLVLGAGGGL